MEPQSDHQMIVLQLVRVRRTDAVGDDDAPVGQVNHLHVAIKELHAPQLAHGIHDIGHVQIAGRHFVQHRREQEKVLAVDERDFHVRVTGQRLLQLQSGIQTAKPTAQNQNLLSSVCAHIKTVMSDE